VTVEREWLGRLIHEAMPCECKKRKILSAAIDKVPEIYKQALEVVPDPARHSSQIVALRTIELDPLGNFGFSGMPGTGKTHFFWHLYMRSAYSGLMVRATSLRGLLDQFQANFGKNYEQAVPPLITADQLRQNHNKYGLFLDDIDKARPSEYAMEQLFELLDAASSYGHQLVWTTNLPVSKLEQHFYRFDDRFGGAILRRLMDHTNLVEMF
jgi:DNA replication protein DnaC